MSEIIPKESAPLAVPGIGVAGVVMCPFGFQKTPCLKGGCEWWVELKVNDTNVARCAMAWGPVLLVELRQEIERLGQNAKSITEKG